jgi:hypothetical protein
MATNQLEREQFRLKCIRFVALHSSFVKKQSKLDFFFFGENLMNRFNNDAATAYTNLSQDVQCSQEINNLKLEKLTSHIEDIQRFGGYPGDCLKFVK